MAEQLKEVLLSIEGLDERFATLIIKYFEKYVDMSSNKSLVATNLIQQIKKNITGINFKNLDGISGCVSGLGSSITIDSNLEDWVIDNTFLHEFTHQISRNEYTEKDENGNIDYIQTNLGLKVAFEQSMEFSMGARLKNWETDGNNYAFNKGIITFDEWITEWLANKMSDFSNVELKEDENGFFRKKTCHGYDGSNVMNMLELVYGSENIANLLTGFDLTEDERKDVIPIKEFHKLNKMIDSNLVLSEDEINIFKNLQPPYMQTPNITGLIVYYISQYQKQDNLENYNIVIQKMLDVLTRTYSISFKNRIDSCNSIDELKQVYTELSVIQNSMIWNEDQEKLNILETYRLYDEMRNKFSIKLNTLGIDNNEFVSLYATPSELLEKFRIEESDLKELHTSSLSSTQRI